LPYGKVDKCIFSPPYAEVKKGGEASEAEGLRLAKAMEKSNPKYGKRDTPGRILHLRKEQSGYSENRDNIGNLPYGSIDKIVTSPPYASGGTKADENPENYIRREEERLKLFPNRPKTFVGRYSGDRNNIGNLRYGKIEDIDDK